MPKQPVFFNIGEFDDPPLERAYVPRVQPPRPSVDSRAPPSPARSLFGPPPTPPCGGGGGGGGTGHAAPRPWCR